jgi:hypothetical protein
LGGATPFVGSSRAAANCSERRLPVKRRLRAFAPAPECQSCSRQHECSLAIRDAGAFQIARGRNLRTAPEVVVQETLAREIEHVGPPRR